MTLATTFEHSTPPLETVNGKPALLLPGPGHLVSYFASDLADLLQGQGIFARKGAAFVLDHSAQKLEPASPAWLRTWVENHVVPYRSKSGTNGPEIKIAQTMPDDIARAVLASPQFLGRLPKVERFHPCPMPWMREDGRIELLPEGLDAPSQTFTAACGFEIAPLALREAREALDSLLAEFAWPEDGGRSKSVAISAMLTVFAGGILPPRSLKPVFLYVANAEGSGKTTLAQLAGISYEEAPAESAPCEESEWQKRIMALVISGRRIVIFDNVKGHLNSGALEGYTTAATYRGRILGASKDFEGEAGATVLVTGNGLTVTPDLRRRALFVELFLQELRAEDRTFKQRLTGPAIAARRPAILCALWGIVRAWDEAGRPSSSRCNSSFPEWCESVGGIVEFAGWGCPTMPAEIEGMGDTDTADFQKLAGMMASGTRYSFPEIVTMAVDAGLFERVTSDKSNNGEELSKSARSKLSKLLGRFDRRRVTSQAVFKIEGQGKTRKYAVVGHGGNGGHGVSPVLEKCLFPIGLEDHADHADHARKAPPTPAPEACDY